MGSSALAARARRSIAPLAALLLLITACDSVDVTTVPATRVQISPPTTIVGVGGGAQLEAAVLGENDQPLAGRSVAWLSEDETIATVSPSGVITGVSPGMAVIRANSEGATGTASVTVTESPAIAVSPLNVSFTAVQNGASPGDRSVAITNAGAGSLTNLSATVRYADGQPTGWLTATLNGSGAPTTLILSAAPGSLPVGTYNATVDIASGDAINSPAPVPVTFQVLAPTPAIGLGTTTVSFSSSQGGANPGSQTVAVTNLGGGTLTGVTSSITYSPGQPGGWLNVSPSGTTAPLSLVISATTGSLQPGTYTAHVNVSSAVAQNSPQTIVVTFTVAAPTPRIAVNPSELTFTARQGAANPSNQTVQITNAGGGSINDLEISITYPGGQPAGWVTTSLNRSQAPATLTVGAVTGTLATGTYSATIRVASAAASNSPVLIDVTFNITQAEPAIAISRSSVSFSAQVGGGNPDAQTVSITNSGGGTLSGLSASIVGPAAPWLSAQLTGTTAPTTLTLNAVTGNRAAGTYNATVRLSAGTASNSPVDIAVTFTIADGTPAAPSGLTATARSDQRIDVAWSDQSGDESEFQVERRVGSGDWSNVATTGVNQTSFTDSGVTGSATYEYRVRACNAVGCSNYSNTAAATTAPIAPSGAAASVTSVIQINVTWSDNSPDETGFRVERSIDGGQNWILASLTAANATSYTDVGLAAATTYRYRVSACRGSLCSVYSNEAQATTGSGSTSTPQGFTATATSPTQVDLSWQPPGGQTHYELRRRTGGSGAWTLHVTLEGNLDSYSDTGLTPGTLYDYQIRACAAGSCSEYSSRVAVTTPGG